MNKWTKIKSLGEAPTEASQNLRTPELNLKDNRFTGRTKKISFTCLPEFAEKLRKLAFTDNCYQIEILEKALELYQRQSFSEKSETKNWPKTSTSAENSASQTKLNQSNQFKDNSSCSFFGKDTKTQQEFYLDCPQPVFDKKKQLCRSHNKQVWKRFNQFLKSKPSVSSTATWLSTWEDSGDWKYFWDLGEKQENNE